MRVRELLERVIAGEVEIDKCEHIINDPVEDLRDAYAYTLGRLTAEDCSENLKTIYRSEMDREVVLGRLFYLSFYEIPRCMDCGERLWWSFDGQKLKLDRTRTGRPTIEVEAPPCPWAKVFCSGGSLTIETKLVFANYFRSIPDAPKQRLPNLDYSLNSLTGQQNVQFVKSNHGVAIGQMGNMSVDIWKHREQPEVILARVNLEDYTAYSWATSSGEKTAKKIVDNYERVGRVDCGVWRWEASDLNRVETDVDHMLGAEWRGSRPVILDVPLGTWNWEHYYSFGRSEEEPVVFSRFWHYSLNDQIQRLRVKEVHVQNPGDLLFTFGRQPDADQ